MRKLVIPGLAAVVLVAVLVATVGYLSDERTPGALTLVEVTGQVIVDRADRPSVPAHSGDQVEARDRVATSESSRAVLELGPETRINLGPVATIQVRAVDEEGVSIELEEGAVQATVRPDSGALRLSNSGRQALVTDGDLAMGVLPDETLLLEVTRGDAMLGGIVGASALGEGSRLVVGAGDHAELGRIPDDMLLQVRWPERPRTRDETIVLEGTTEPGARVTVLGSGGEVHARADRHGLFEVEVPLLEGENPLRVRAVDLMGDEVDVIGVVERDQSGPTFRGGVEYGN